MYGFYQKLSSQQKDAADSSSSAAASVEGAVFSSKCQEFLASVLHARPALGAALLQALCAATDSTAPQITESFHLLHLRCLHHIFNAIKEVAHCSTALETADRLRMLTEKFYDVLAFFDPNPTMVHLQTSLREFFLSLLKTIHELRAGGNSSTLLEEHFIYSALLGRETPYLVQVYTESEQILRTEDSLSAEKSLAPVADLSHVEICLVAAARLSDRKEAWRRMSLMCVKHQKHFLDLIMVICFVFLNSLKSDRIIVERFIQIMTK